MGNRQSSKEASITYDAIISAGIRHEIPREFVEEAVNIILENTHGKEIDPDEVYMFSLCDDDTREVIRKVYVELNEQGIPNIKIVNPDENPYEDLTLKATLRRDKKGKKVRKKKK